MRGLIDTNVLIFPNRLAALDRFLSVALLTMDLVPIPTDEDIVEL